MLNVIVVTNNVKAHINENSNYVKLNNLPFHVRDIFEGREGNRHYRSHSKHVGIGRPFHRGYKFRQNINCLHRIGTSNCND